MPAFITHQIFAKKISEKITIKNFDKKTFEIFAQSHDLFYYYMTFDKKERKTVKDYGKKFHRKNTQSFIINLVRTIKSNNLVNDKESLGFLYGVISHYVLDSTFHPYIFYKTGIYNKKDKKTKKYQGLHNQIERNLDVYYYQKYYHKKINKLKVLKLIPKIKPSNNLKNLIDQTYKKTYHKENVSKYLIEGYKHARINLFMFSQDKFGIKKQIYKIISSIKYLKPSVLANYSYNQKVIKRYLNKEKDTWIHPSTDQEFNYSVEDLFNQSLRISIFIINEVNKVLNNRKRIEELDKIIPNISYITGLSITNNSALKTFEI